MKLNEQQGFILNELSRRLANTIRVGKVCEVDYEKAVAKVMLGDNKTAFLPWITNKAGADQNWNPIDIGEQVVVLAPNGELNRGVILHSLYQKTIPAPATSKNMRAVFFEDGSCVQYDTDSKTLTVELQGTGNINVVGSVNITCQTANITAETTTIDGNAVITGTTTIKGDAVIMGTVALSGGGSPIARVGDQVSVDPITHIGQIDTGSATATSG